MEDNYSKDLISFKILLLGGGSFAGKSCILYRYSANKFLYDGIPTLGLEFGTKKIKFGKHNIKL